jgi:sulfopyruvate decarboxylase TPP-binding subunit
VIWIPDSATGLLQPLFDRHPSPKLVRVCREGEAFGIAAGLLIGGAKPLVIVQCTGFFEAGDAFRNVVHDLKLPIFVIIGWRGYEAWKANPVSSDSARTYAEPILKAWGIRYVVVGSDEDASRISETWREATDRQEAAAILLAEP